VIEEWALVEDWALVLVEIFTHQNIIFIFLYKGDIYAFLVPSLVRYLGLLLPFNLLQKYRLVQQLVFLMLLFNVVILYRFLQSLMLGRAPFLLNNLLPDELSLLHDVCQIESVKIILLVQLLVEFSLPNLSLSFFFVHFHCMLNWAVLLCWICVSKSLKLIIILLITGNKFDNN